MQITSNLKWISSRLLIAVVVLTSVFTTSCKNMFAELADKESGAALHYQAMRLLDQRLYTEAIDVITNQMPTDYAARRDVQVTLAEAYVGRCGLEYLDLAVAIKDKVAADSIMDVALAHMKSVTSYADCLTAETVLRNASPNGDGIMSDNTNDAFLMAFISIAKIGAILADDTASGAAGDADNDGDIDGGFDACALGDPVTRQLGSALTLIYNNIASSGSVIVSSMSSLTTLCTTPPISTAGTCAKTSAAAFAAPAELQVIRGLLNYQSIGVGSDVAYTVCP